METKYGPYSPHRLEVATCGFSFYHRYVAEESRTLKQERSVASDRGSAAHEVLEKITLAMQRNDNYNFTPQELRDWVADAVQRYPLAYEEITEIYRMAELYVARPPQLHSEARTEERLAVRLVGDDFEPCEYDDPGAYARGRIDIVDMTDDASVVTIYDHKTQPNIEEADTAQMAFYAWLMWRTYPWIKQVRTVLHFARYGRYSEPVSWTTEELEDIEANIMTQVDVIEARTTAEATPHKGCQYCPLLTTCPVMREHLTVSKSGQWQVLPTSLKVLGSAQKAQHLAGLLSIAEELVKRLKEELKEHVKATEMSVMIPGKVIGYQVSEPKIDWDYANKHQKSELCDIIKKHGDKPERFMSFNASTTPAAGRHASKELLSEMQSVLKVKVTSEFRSSKL